MLLDIARAQCFTSLMESSANITKNTTFAPTRYQSILLALNYVFMALWTPAFFGIALFSNTPGDKGGKHLLVSVTIFGFFLTLVSTVIGRYLIAKGRTSRKTTLLLLLPSMWFIYCIIVLLHLP